MSHSHPKLGPRTEKIYKDIAERLIPSGGPDYPGAGDINLVDYILNGLADIPIAIKGLSVVMWGWEISPLFSRKLSLFTRMDPVDQLDFLDGCEKSWFSIRRWSLILLKAIFQAFFYNHPRVWEKLGYTEECLYKRKDAGKGSEDAR